MASHATGNRIQRIPVAYWLLLAAPVLVHFFLLWHYATNAPRLDDFSDALVFLPHFRDAHTLTEHIQIFFSLYNEHRYGVNHSLYWLCSALQDGALNFRWLTITGNLFLVGLLVLLCQCVRSSPHAPGLWAITALLLFNLQGWFGMFWATAAIDRIAALLFGLATFMLVVHNTTRSLLIAMITASLATLSQGNGIFVWPIVGFYLWFSTGSVKQLRFLLWVSCATTALLLYFSHFIFFSREGNAPLHTALPDIISLAQRLLGGMLALPGSWLLYPDTNIAITLSIAIGALLWASLAFLLAKKCLWKQPALLMLLVFMTGSILSVTLFRTLIAGLDQALQGHYKVFAALLLWLVIVAAYEYAARNNGNHAQRIVYSSLLLAVALYIAALIKFFPIMQADMRQLAEDTHRWLYTHNLQRAETLYYVPRYNEKLQYAVDNGAYNPWTLAADSETIVGSKFVAACNNTTMTALDTLQVRGQPKALAVRVTGEIDAVSANGSLTILLCSAEGGVQAQLNSRNLQPSSTGKYTLDVLVPRHNIPSREWTVFACQDCVSDVR